MKVPPGTLSFQEEHYVAGVVSESGLIRHLYQVGQRERSSEHQKNWAGRSYRGHKERFHLFPRKGQLSKGLEESCYDDFTLQQKASGLTVRTRVPPPLPICPEHS